MQQNRRPGHCACCTCTHSESPSPSRIPAVDIKKDKNGPLDSAEVVIDVSDGDDLAVQNLDRKVAIPLVAVPQVKEPVCIPVGCNSFLWHIYSVKYFKKVHDEKKHCLAEEGIQPMEDVKERYMVDI